MYQQTGRDIKRHCEITTPHTHASFEARQLACLKGRRSLFSGINIQLHAGHALHVRGSNGSGKSSLLRILCGLVSPEQGVVLWSGRPVHALREEFHQYLFFHGHATGIKDDLLAWENLAFNARLAGVHCSYAMACEALKAMDLLQAALLPAGQLSQGQRKRLALGRLYLPDLPQLLILDEAFSALDQNATAILAAILEAHLQQGGMLIYTTHQDIHLQAPAHQELWLGERPC
ncbi:cytochrome c biogenesis heme-transporting ATPase CcmA [Undibacterium sp. Di27W]|uniref:cytochrome c biogenesis heme-transporting ATPase CcmA n=1 Tax=Undibacterium sp. Di27W TaxID=3413036 RepID=UPI003BF1E702